jgi:site-specific DNA-adenine methylase
MPPYVGGKSRMIKGIREAINKEINGKKVNNFYDLFCGGLSVSIGFVDCYDVYSSDNNEDLIYMWNKVKDSNFYNECPIVTKEQFDELKKQTTLSLDKSFAMFYCTFMCMYKGSHIINIKKNRTQGYFNNIKKNEDSIKKIKEITCKEYKDFDFSNGNNIIYCDPPYINTVNTYKSKNFNHDEFWTQLKKWTDMGNYVFVSEKTCPIEHKVIYEKELPVNMSKEGKTMVDKLFLII